MKPTNFLMMAFGILLIAILVALPGCGAKGVIVQPHPDAPLYISESWAGYVHAAVYDKERNALVDCGWLPLNEYKGWTLHKFNWQERIAIQDAKLAEAKKEKE